MKVLVDIEDYNEPNTLFFRLMVDKKYLKSVKREVKRLPDLFHQRKDDDVKLRKSLGISDKEFKSKPQFDWNDWYNVEELKKLLLTIPTLGIIYDSTTKQKIVTLEF